MNNNQIDSTSKWLRTKSTKSKNTQKKQNEENEITRWIEYWALAYRHKQKWEWTVKHTLKCGGAHNFPFYFKCPRYGLRQPKCIAKTFRLRRWRLCVSVRTSVYLCRCVNTSVSRVFRYHDCCWCLCCYGCHFVCKPQAQPTSGSISLCIQIGFLLMLLLLSRVTWFEEREIRTEK